VPFIQFLSVTDLDMAVVDFSLSRSQTLKSFPPELSSAQARSLFGGNGTNAVSNSSNSDVRTSAITMTVVADTVERQGLIVVGLLCGNIVVGLVLFVMGLVLYTRRGRKIGTSRNDRSFTPAVASEVEISAVKYSD